ncbi:MAG: flagellar hook-basal body complex protein [Rhodobacterales bacterium]|nr:flagellar hook-basal body complex protein [Rhodobacterales bacterium]
MSLFNTLNTGASGMSTAGTGLGVIGDNIANMNTTGYKRNQARFADAFPNSIGTQRGIQQLGSGALNSQIVTTFEQGMLQGTGSALDVAITGVGFFQVSDGQEDFFTRDGSFALDKSGYVVNAQGLNLQGYNAQDGVVGAMVGDLQLELGPYPPQATESIVLDAVLNPIDNFQVDEIVYQLLQPTLDGTIVAPTLEEATAAADFSTSVTIYDSLGRPHDVAINFEQVDATGVPAETDWLWSAVVDAGSVDTGGGVFGEDGRALEIASGSLTFDSDGVLTSYLTAAPATPVTWPGAAPYDCNMEVGIDAAGLDTPGSLIAVGSGDSGWEDPSLRTNWVGAANNGSVSSIQQDGFTIGDLSSLAVDAEGKILGQYTNGEDLVLGQLSIATFSAEGGLERLGSNLYKQTLSSGDAAVGMAGTGNRGSTNGYNIERSNVDLEEEFVSMIQMQRSYQANTGVISTVDETLQELVNLV